jgi:hypothetical protein
MATNALQTFIQSAQASWGPLSTDLIGACRGHLEALAQAPAYQPWLVELHAIQPASKELHRDETYGFLLLAHTESEGLYRPPHDHGRSWVIYAVQRGEVEMCTYARVETNTGDVRLVKRDSTVVRAGEAKVFLPGDIHDTRCLSETALLFRFTERDLRKEDLEEHRITRYVMDDGVYTVRPS